MRRVVLSSLAIAIGLALASTPSAQCQSEEGGAPNSPSAIGTTRYQLSVSKTGAGAGRVISRDHHINCGTTCSWPNYRFGEQVSLQAVSSAGSSFAAWSGCDRTYGVWCVLRMTAARTVTASFSALNGNYAFNSSGHKNGNLVVMAGAFVAKGDGTFQAVRDSKGVLCNQTVPLIYAGCLDYNDGSGEALQSGTNPIAQFIVAAQSSYSLGPNGLGTMKLVTDQGNTFNFHIAIGPDGSGTLVEDSGDPQRGAGQIKKQTPADFQVSSVNGNWALGYMGVDPSGKRYAGAGSYATNPITMLDIDCGTSTWNLPLGNCPGDSDDNGTAASQEFKGTYSGFIDANTGRGNFAKITYFRGSTPLYTVINTYYIVSHNEFVLVSTNQVKSTNPFPLVLWSVRRQIHSATGFDNTVLSGTSVAAASALDTNGAADVTAGLLVGAGVSGHTCPSADPLSFQFDQNQGGVSQSGMSAGTYCINGTTGRITLSGFAPKTGLTTGVMYAIAANQGFVVGTDSAVTSAYVEQQSGAPFNTSSIAGTYVGGTLAPVLPVITDAVTWLSSDGNGAIIGTSDTSGQSGNGQQNMTYTYVVNSAGGVVFDGESPAVGYVISPGKVVLFPTTDPNPALTILQSSAN